MKTTIDISDHLLKSAKARARREGITLREIVERSLRAALKEERAVRPFKLKNAAVKGQGLQEEIADMSWAQLRSLSYGFREN